MIPRDLHLVAEDFLAAALLGTAWSSPLARLAAAAGAGGAVLARYEGKRLLTLIPTDGLADAARDFVEGRAPVGARHALPVRPTELGFRTDYDDFDAALIDKDPYYQDFLRPIGFYWHANIGFRFATGEEIEIGLKRQRWHGHYDRADIAALNTLRRDLRASMRLARGIVDAETAGVLRMVHQRGDPAYELDRRGRVIRVHQDHVRSTSVSVIGKRLIVADQSAQATLDRAIHMAVTMGQSAVAPVGDHGGQRAFLQVVPVTGDARDVFHSTVAIAVLIDQGDQSGPVKTLPKAVQSAFGLTRREAEVAALLAQGLSLSQAASRLRLQTGTTRNHLKTIFQKTGTTRQGELVALLWTLRP